MQDIMLVYENLQRCATGRAKRYWMVWVCPSLASFIFILLICNQLPQMVIVTVRGNDKKKILKHYGWLHSVVIEAE